MCSKGGISFLENILRGLIRVYTWFRVQGLGDLVSK